MRTKCGLVGMALAALLLISLAVNLQLFGEIRALKPGAAPLSPELLSVQFSDASGQEVTDDGWVTVPADGLLQLTITLKGSCTSIDLFLTPTGTETYWLQRMIATLDVAPGQERVDFLWEAPKAIMAHLNLIAWNGMWGTRSDTYSIYSPD